MITSAETWEKFWKLWVRISSLPIAGAFSACRRKETVSKLEIQGIVCRGAIH